MRQLCGSKNVILSDVRKVRHRQGGWTGFVPGNEPFQTFGSFEGDPLDRSCATPQARALIRCPAFFSMCVTRPLSAAVSGPPYLGLELKLAADSEKGHLG